LQLQRPGRRVKGEKNWTSTGEKSGEEEAHEGRNASRKKTRKPKENLKGVRPGGKADERRLVEKSPETSTGSKKG